MATQNLIALDRIRVFITLLVVAHHSVLAYVQHGYFDQEHYLWSTAPIVDSNKWIGFDLFVLFNDTFFMSLMFLLSGLFVWPSLLQKGASQFLRERARRLGLPFVVVALTLMPLAYYPSSLLTGSNIGFGAFWREAIAIGPWPTGPAWFIWLLLVFDFLAVAAVGLMHETVVSLGRASLESKDRPMRAFLLLVGVSMLAYFVMVLPFGATYWLAFGPFAVQASRILLYMVYFFFGVILGAGGLEKGLLSCNGMLRRRWLLWLGSALGTFFALVIMQVRPSELSITYWRITQYVLQVVSCGFLTFALVAIFLRYKGKGVSVLDRVRSEA